MRQQKALFWSSQQRTASVRGFVSDIPDRFGLQGDTGFGKHEIDTRPSPMPSSGAASGTLFTQVSHSLSSNVVSQQVLDSRVSRNEHAYTSCYRGRRTIRDATTECIKRSHPTLGTRKGGWQHWASASQQPGTGMRYYLDACAPPRPNQPASLA